MDVIDYIGILILFVLGGLVIYRIITRILIQGLLGHGVPYVPTPDYKVNILMKNMKMSHGQNFVDLGCGDGKIVEEVKQNFPKVRATGIESSWYPYFLAKKKEQESNCDYRILRGNFFSKNLGEYDHIYCFLLPSIIPKLWKKIERECKPGTLLYSSAFEIKDFNPTDKIYMANEKYIYVYKL